MHAINVKKVANPMFSRSRNSMNSSYMRLVNLPQVLSVQGEDLGLSSPNKGIITMLPM
jgi:hypothetical protein